MEIQKLETKRGSVFIHEALVSDAEQFRELRLDARQESPTAFPADYSAHIDYPVSFWENRLKSDGMGAIFFAEHENQLIGMTGNRRGESPKTKHGATIWGVYARPQWRGLRIADSLIEACIERAKSNTVNIVKLGVTVASISAIRCYERCGFVIWLFDVSPAE